MSFDLAHTDKLLASIPKIVDENDLARLERAFTVLSRVEAHRIHRNYARFVFEHLVHKAIEHGWLEGLVVMETAKGIIPWVIPIMRDVRLYDKTISDPRNSIGLIISEDARKDLFARKKSIVHYLVSIGVPFNGSRVFERVLKSCADNDDRHAVPNSAVQWLRFLRDEIGISWSSDGRECVMAAEYNRPTCLRYVIEVGAAWNDAVRARVAVAALTRPGLVFFSEMGDRRGSAGCLEIALNELLRDAKNDAWTAHVLSACLPRLRNLQGYRYGDIHSKIYTGDDICAHAANCMDVECLRVMHRHLLKSGQRLTSQTLVYANGISVFAYAYKNGAPCDERTCLELAKRGKIVELKIVVESGDGIVLSVMMRGDTLMSLLDGVLQNTYSSVVIVWQMNFVTALFFLFSI